TEVRDADDLALELILPAGERDADLVAQVADDFSGHAVGKKNAGGRRARALGRDEPRPERLRRRACRPCQARVTREHVFETFGEDELPRRVRAADERDRRRPRGRVLLLVVALALKAEVEARRIRSRGAAPR